MAVTLIRPYAGNASGSTLEGTTELEAALVAQGLASTALATAITTGPVTSNTFTGTAAVPAASASIVITNSLVNATSKVFAVVSQAAADGTFLRVERIVCAAGSFTIYGTAAATATTYVDWAVLTAPALTNNP